MCMARPKMPTIAAPLIAAPDNTEAIQQGELEAMLRRRRAGAAANILTSPVGIPATRKLGGMAA
jgi:hypothetical protein